MKAALLHDLRRDLAGKRPCATVTDMATGAQALVSGTATSGDAFLSADHLAEVRRRIATDRSGVIAETQIFVRVYTAPPRMIIVGAVHIAQALAPMAKLAGFEDRKSTRLNSSH